MSIGRSAANYTDRELDEKPEFLEVEVSKPEDALYAQVYAIENPGTMIALDYDTAFIQRGATEEVKEVEGLDVKTRIPGGATTYPDENYDELLLSDGCFKDFSSFMFEEMQERNSDTFRGNKDIFLDDGGRMEDFPKLIGFAARVGMKQNPNLYGASWREGPATSQTLENVKEDVTSANAEEYRESFETVDMWDELTEDAVQKIPEDLISELDTTPEDYATYSTHLPESCVVEYGPTDGKPAVNWPPGK